MDIRKGKGMIEGYTLQLLEERIGYHFKDINLLKQAITHSSFSNEQKINRQKHYERVEFLGDAVLEIISSEFLYNQYPDLPEGDLTRIRASIVCEPTLAMCTDQIHLGEYIFLGKGEDHTGGRKRKSINTECKQKKEDRGRLRSAGI